MSVEMAVEREMPLMQRTLIDNCFEENQYEYGIDLLDKLRVNSYKPASTHMKQVIYIALYPLPSSEKIKRKNGNPLSPIKLQMQKQRDDSWPSPTSRPLAIALLHALVATNSPASLLRGLPHYAYVNIDGAKDVDPFQNQKSEADDKHDDMSPLQPEIHRIFPNLKDIWGLLAKDLIKRKQYDLGRRITNDSDDEDDKENTIASRTVGPYAWPVLEWFISVFEKDQENHGGKYSPILLTQIPSPRTQKGPRWEVEAVIQVIRSCFSKPSQKDLDSSQFSVEKRCDLGNRLLSLIVNLTLTEPMFLAPPYLLLQLSAYLLDVPLSATRILLSSIRPDHSRFKIVLLDTFLSMDDTTSKAATSAAPRAKAKPKVTGAKASQPEASSTPPVVAKRTDPYPFLDQEKVVYLLSTPPISTTVASEGRVTHLMRALGRYHLLSAMFNLKLSTSLQNIWDPLIRDGYLSRALSAGYVQDAPQIGNSQDAEEVGTLREASVQILKVWESMVKTV